MKFNMGRHRLLRLVLFFGLIWFDFKGIGFAADGPRERVISAEMHAARVPAEAWPDRLRRLHALGVNTVSTYVVWNQIELSPGRFDWSGQNDIAGFCRAAQKEGLRVILRPGPYVCGELDFGGLPWWLLLKEPMHLRSSDPEFLRYCRRYLAELAKQVVPLQSTQGGPIDLVQVENEYEGFGADSEYIERLCALFKEVGFDVPLFTSDMTWSLRPRAVPGLIRGVGFTSDPERNFAAVRRVQPSGPLFCSEFYTGWFDVWGRPGNSKHVPRREIEALDKALGMGAWVNLYMGHGGTSFGFLAGANYPPFRPHPTSYDYGAPLDESGRPTEKFHAIRKVLQKYQPVGSVMPPVPEANRVLAIPSFSLVRLASLESMAGTAVSRLRPVSMEALGQGRGCVLYRTEIPAGRAAELIVTEVHDFGVVMIDGVRVGTVDRMRGEKSVRIPAREKPARLDIVVEAMGHVQFGTYLGDRKGITERVELSDAYGSSEVLNWRMFPLFLESDAVSKIVTDRSVGNSPALYRGEFKVREPADTFLDLRGWTKGMVWVNGHNLGRFWNIGPQQTLYLPGVWMRKGANEIRVLDFLPPDRPVVAGLTNAILDQLDFASSGRLHRRDGQKFQSDRLKPVASGAFAAGVSAQVVRFAPVTSRYLCLEALTSQGGDAYSSCAEIQVLDSLGRSIPRDRMKVEFADSEELVNEDASGDRVLDGRIDSFWHTQWNREDAPHPHQLVLDLGVEQVISGIQYIPRQDRINGRIGAYRVYVSSKPFSGL